MKEFNFHSAEELKAANVTFDWAVPMNFQRKIYRLTGHNMNSHIVMTYKKGDAFGVPVAVTKAGAVMLGAFDLATESNYSDFELEEK